MTTYRLTKIQPEVLGDHGYLTSKDNCYYFGEYTARVGSGYSPTNQLIYSRIIIALAKVC